MHLIILNDIQVVSLVNVLCTHLEDTLLVYKTSRRPLCEFSTVISRIRAFTTVYVGRAQKSG
jgi:hypothetical protein